MGSPDSLSGALSMLRDMQVDEEAQADFEIDFFRSVLARNADNVDVIRRLVELLSRRREYGAALSLYTQLIRRAPTDFIARYNLACTLSMLGRIDEAATALTEAVEAGYNDIPHLEADPDMNPMRRHPAYIRIIGNYDDSIVS